MSMGTIFSLSGFLFTYYAFLCSLSLSSSLPLDWVFFILFFPSLVWHLHYAARVVAVTILLFHNNKSFDFFRRVNSHPKTIQCKSMLLSHLTKVLPDRSWATPIGFVKKETGKCPTFQFLFVSPFQILAGWIIGGFLELEQTS